MSKKIVLILAALTALISGCKSTDLFEAGYVADVDSSISLNQDSNIAVMPLEKGNVEESAKYIDAVVNSFREKGYKNAYAYENIQKLQLNIDAAVLVNVDTRNQQYTYYEAIPQVVNYAVPSCATGSSCKKEYKQKVVNTIMQPVAESKEVHLVTLDLFDSKKKKQLMSVMGYSTDNKCSNRINDILVSETLNKMNFESKSNHRYSVNLPQDETC